MIYFISRTSQSFSFPGDCSNVHEHFKIYQMLLPYVIIMKQIVCPPILSIKTKPNELDTF